MSTGESAVATAEAALASAVKKQDKRAEVKALQDAVKAYSDLPDTYEALKAAKALLKAQKDLADTKGQAQALLSIGEMHFAMNNLEDALQNEEEALNLYSGLGDSQAEDHVKEALSRVYNKRGDVDMAPNRAKGLAALGELGRAISSNDSTRFQSAMDRCKRMASVSDADIEAVLGEALEKDYLPVARLYKETLDMEGLLPENKGICVHKKYHYLGFRTVGGLHYGPSFQCVQHATVNADKMETYAPVVMPDGLDGWEYETNFNAGILDGIIQVPFSNSVAGYAATDADKQFRATEQAQGQGSLGY
jgi:tetratricopeptide (TPR) repeat protein